VLWRRERVVLEFDSYEFHATRAAFERRPPPERGAHPWPLHRAAHAV
jgi:hypothetical protein